MRLRLDGRALRFENAQVPQQRFRDLADRRGNARIAQRFGHFGSLVQTIQRLHGALIGEVERCHGRRRDHESGCIADILSTQDGLRELLHGLTRAARLTDVDGQAQPRIRLGVPARACGRYCRTRVRHRGVEIAPEVADGDQSVILQQVENGVAVRMAVLYLVAASRGLEPQG